MAEEEEGVATGLESSCSPDMSQQRTFSELEHIRMHLQDKRYKITIETLRHFVSSVLQQWKCNMLTNNVKSVVSTVCREIKNKVKINIGISAFMHY